MPTKIFTSNYPVFIGENLLSELSQFISANNYSRVFVLTDKIVAKYFLQDLKAKITTWDLILESGEEQKHLQSVEQIWQFLAKNKADRKSLLICFGGGVVGDLGGFVASTFKRGIDYLHFPTTILAQTDSSIGGKTGFDYLGQKNLIGSFYEPSIVLIDINYLKTLPDRIFVEGLAEVLKYGLVYDLEFWNWLKQNREKILQKEPKTLQEMLASCVKIKSEVVVQDQKEINGIRKILNFGHTFGHAIEILSLKTKSPLYHGEAVAIGMVLEAKLSQKLNFISQIQAQEIKDTITNFKLPTTFEYSTLIQKSNLDDLIEQIWQKMLGDKKTTSGEIHWSLLEKIGKGNFDQKVKKEDFIDSALCL